MREIIFYIIFAIFLFIILSNLLETYSQKNQENLEAVSPLITIANLAQGLNNGTAIPSNLQVGTTAAPANLSVAGNTTINDGISATGGKSFFFTGSGSGQNLTASIQTGTLAIGKAWQGSDCIASNNNDKDLIITANKGVSILGSNFNAGNVNIGGEFKLPLNRWHTSSEGRVRLLYYTGDGSPNSFTNINGNFYESPTGRHTFRGGADTDGIVIFSSVVGNAELNNTNSVNMYIPGKLSVNNHIYFGDSNISTNVRIAISQIGTNYYNAESNDSGFSSQVHTFRRNNKDISYINWNGHYQLYSDVRLKTNFEPLTNVIDSIKQISGLKYNFKDSLSQKKSIGLIAQEVEKVFPEVVSTNEDGEKLKSISYSTMVPILVEAIKEQQKMIEELQETVKMLVSRLR